MSTSLIKCKQEISVLSSVVSQRKEDFPEETVSSLLDRLFPKTTTSGILWQLKTDFQSGVRIIPWLQLTNPSFGENSPAWKSVYNSWNGFSAHWHSSWGARANNSPHPARACAGGRKSNASVCIPPATRTHEITADSIWQAAITRTPQHIHWVLGDFAMGGWAPRPRVCVLGAPDVTQWAALALCAHARAVPHRPSTGHGAFHKNTAKEVLNAYSMLHVFVWRKKKKK